MSGDQTLLGDIVGLLMTSRLTAYMFFLPLVFGMFLFIGGMLFGFTIVAVFGVAIMALNIVAWVYILQLMGQDLEGEEQILHEPIYDEYQAVPSEPPRSFSSWAFTEAPDLRPEPGYCHQCEGKLFLGRDHCPHCGAQVEDVLWDQ